VTYFIGRRPWLLVPLIAGLAVGAVMLIALWRKRGWQTVALLLGAPLAYQLPIMATDVFREDAIRLSMPLIPGLIIATVYVALLVAPRLNQLVPSALRGDSAHKE
jgi:predicted permease